MSDEPSLVATPAAGEIAAQTGRRCGDRCRSSGIRSIAIYTAPDRGAPWTVEADEAVFVGSYLSIEAVVDAARHADALHPGYGFLSENAALARACAAAGVVFVGPSPESIELMGDKVRAKPAARAAGVPVVPDFTVEEARVSDAYPLLVKAAAGGGGRGMRVVESPAALDEAIAAAQREAEAGFGDDRVFIERFLPRARHIEVQVLGDAHGNVVSLGERECSLQRRHQKVLEESPSPVVAPPLRARLGEEAVALARGLRRRRHGRVHRRRRRPVDPLLPRDERAAAGRASGDGARHRAWTWSSSSCGSRPASRWAFDGALAATRSRRA